MAHTRPCPPAPCFTPEIRCASRSRPARPGTSICSSTTQPGLQVAPSEAGYIYLFQHDATAGWNLVTSQRVEKAQLYVLPSTGGLRSDVPARLELLLVLSRLEQPTFATPQTADVDALASKAQAAFRIMIEYR